MTSQSNLAISGKETKQLNKTLISNLTKFVPHLQLRTVLENLKGEEGEFFANKLCEIESTLLSIPPVYGQDGAGDDAIVYLHYFSGGSDWYITEKDVEDPFDEPYVQSAVMVEQDQAFGLARLNSGSHNAELGYIAISELIKIGMVELDFHWKPTRLGDIRKEFGNEK